MNFDLTEDESMLKSMTERFVQDRYDTETRRAYLAESTGFSKENWALLGELGILAAALPEAAGGLDLGAALDPNPLPAIPLGDTLVIRPQQHRPHVIA